jgi:hypothetical protein
MRAHASQDVRTALADVALLTPLAALTLRLCEGIWGAQAF